MKIYVFDHWERFMKPVVAHWRAQGHEVKHERHWGPKLVEWAQSCYFYPVNNNLLQASKRQEKPQDTRIVAEAVDIDIYAGHPGAINWDYVDALVVMSSHMKRVLIQKCGKPSVPIHIVPGGVDLDKFTLRQKPRGYNVAWIGRFWIAKNVFGALQIFRQLIRADPASPWRLFLRGAKWDPYWWKVHCLAYLEDNPALAERVVFVEERVPDMNAWLEDMDYLLQTSFKEAFGYVVAEAAAKGIRPVVQNTHGARETWPDEWVFDTHGGAVHMLQTYYDARQVRGIIAERYPLEARLRALDRIMGLT